MGRALSVIGVPTGPGEYSAALEGLTALNEYLLRANPDTPSLHAAGVRYTKESTNGWRDLKKVLASKSGDCEALSTWRTAELRVSGEDPNASVVVYKTGPSKFHAVVLRGDGTIEDPSVELGMSPPAGLLAAYAEWNQKIATAPLEEDRPMVMGSDTDVACAVIGANEAPEDREVSYHVVGTDDGYRAQVRIPLSDGRAIYAETSTSATDREASHKAGRVLGVIGSLWDDLAILVPSPQAQAAIRLAKNEHVQNLATAAYKTGRKAVGLDKSSQNGGGSVFIHRRQAMMTDDLPPDDGQGYPAADDGDAPIATDVMGSDVLDLLEINGVTCTVGEAECLGAINDALARGSTPRTIVGAARGSGRGRSSSSSASGSRSARSSSSSSGARGAAGGAGRQSASGGSSPYGYTPPLAPPPPAYSPGGAGYGGGGSGAGYGGGGGQRFGGAGSGPSNVNPASARAEGLRQLQSNRDKSALLQKGDSGGGGGGGGGDGGSFGETPTAADRAAAEAADADLFAAYYGNQAQQDAQTAYFESAAESSPDAFFGTVNPYEAEAMLADDSIPAQ